MSSIPPTDAQAPADPLYLGYRPRYVRRPDGRVEEERTPLTLEDLLHPQEGDVVMERPIHRTDCYYLFGVLRNRVTGPPEVYVTSDCLIDWGVEGMRNHSPDVAVFVGLRRRPDNDVGSLSIRDFRGRCVLAVEVVSPDSRTNDVDTKMEHYHRVGVETYVIIDQIRHGGPRTIAGFRRGRHGWITLPLTAEGRLPLPDYGVQLGIRDEDRQAVAYDIVTRQPVGDYDEVCRMLEEVDRRNAEMEQTLEDNILETREERRRRAEAEAKQAEAEAKRAEAEEIARRERLARESAEAAAAQRIAQLEALLASMNAGGPPAVS